jgi:hypothetical protein
MLSTTLLVSLLAMYPHGIGMARMRAHSESIATQADAASAHWNVPPALLLSVCLLETHCGQDSGEGGNWGSPVDRRHRHTAGTADNAARDLAHSFAICHTWYAATRRYRSGLCGRDAERGYAAATALHLAERIMARAHVPLPDRWRSTFARRTALASREREARRRSEPLGATP